MWSYTQTIQEKRLSHNLLICLKQHLGRILGDERFVTLYPIQVSSYLTKMAECPGALKSQYSSLTNPPQLKTKYPLA